MHSFEVGEVSNFTGHASQTISFHVDEFSATI
uniref:Uncharacterized protein n=1 Tax=Rhizophora mucronata TaxID=61149 RepID=A0A2P2R1J5_RHIMU